MASLFNNKISETYEGLIKTSDSAIIGLVEKNLTDGLGNASTLSIGTLTASFTGTLDLTNATVVGLSTGAVDSVNGLTGVVVLTTTNIAEGTNLYFTDARVEANSAVALNTAKVGITTSQANAIVANTSKVSFPEAPNDGQQYARQSQAWAVVSGGGAVDSVNGQTGVVVLDTDNISEGTTNLYFTDSRVNANSNVAANTAKVGITTTQANEIAANTLKVGITTQQATDITNNNAKVGITTSQASDITNNNAKISFDSAASTKLNGIETGAQVNTVNSVNSLTGAVSLGLLELDDVGVDGTNGQVLTTNGSGSFSFTTVSGGGAVNSVNGQTGTVVLDTDDINEGTTNLYYTEARVSANSSVAANTTKVGITSQQSTDITNNNAKVGITTQQASDITTNNAKVGITTTQADEIAANTLKTGITTQQATDITNNNAKVGITTQQASDITSNNAKVGYTDALVSANSDVVANTAKVGITSSQATAITNNTAKNSYPTADATKLAGIQAGAEVNDVDSVNGATGVVSLGLLDLDDVGSDGVSGQVLTTDGSGSFTFTTVSSGGGGVSSVTGTGSVSGLTLTTGGTSSAPVLTLGGTLSLTSSNVTDGLGFTPYNSTNPAGYITTYTVTSSDVTSALGFTPYSDANPDNFISSYTVTNSDVITALGFTPYNNTNPSNFTSNLGIVQSVTGNAGSLEIVSGVLNVPPSAAAPVDSVNGATGVVVLDTDDIAQGTTNKYMVLGTSATTALAGNTSLLQLGTTSTTALAGDTTTITPTQAANITTNNSKVSMVLGTTAGTALEGDTTTITTAQANEITANTAKVSFVDAPSNGNEYARKNGAWVVVTDADSVTSVNGQTGAVSLDTDDISEGSSNLYFTDARVAANSAVTLNTAKVGFTQALVSANTDVVANTAKVGITTQQATDITNNNAKVSMVIGTASDEAMAGNTTTITPTQASNITANNAKNSYPSADATKLAGIETGAEVNVQSNWNETDTNSDAFIQNKPSIPSAAPVDSVNGDTGVVVLDTDDIGEGSTNLYYTEARVSANSSVAANTAKVGITTQQASDISTNNNKVGITTQQASDITANNAKVSMVLGTSAGTALEGDTALLQLGTTSTTALAGDTTTITPTQAANITTNNAKISFENADSTKLAGIEAGAEVNTIDSSTTGEGTGAAQVLNVVSMSASDYASATKVATTLYIIT